MPTRWASPSHGNCVRLCGPLPRRARSRHSARPLKAQPPFSLGFARPSAEARPRFGATLDGVQRLQETLVPRARQAPDGRQEGGTQSTDISLINRRLFLAPALPLDTGQEDEENAKISVAHS